ncbi:MAG: B12-binding domain-containing radical SAM protein, partial [Nitrospinota bacterium]|nr:B12-binding domain-containing radical SAM protein [Nitrospinota bacterium]
FVGTVLKKAGNDVRTLFISPGTDIPAAIKGYIDDFKPTMFCFSAVTSQYPVILQAAKEVKKLDPNLYTIIGGHHASLAPDEVMGAGVFDAVCITEGEAAVLQVAKALDDGRRPAGIENLWIRRPDGTVEKNRMAKLNEDLDELPFIDRDLWVPWMMEPGTLSTIIVSRGCPYRCTYCSNHAMSKLAEGKYLRHRSFDNILAEMREVLSRWPGITHIYFEAETFGANLKYALEFLARLREFNALREKPIKWGFNLNVTKKTMNNLELWAAMQAANVGYVNVGLESGSERMRKEVLRRPEHSNDDIVQFCDNARKHNVEVYFSVLIGIPGETLADYNETVDLVRRSNPAHCYPYILFPYPGTDMFETARKMGLLDKEIDHTAERSRAVLDLPGFSKWRIQYEFIMFHFKTRKGRWPMYQRLAYTAKNGIKLFPNVFSEIIHIGRTNMLARFLYRKLSNAPDAQSV